MKTLLFISLFVVLFKVSKAQTPINDRANISQQERMVYKQWDKNKFYPKPYRVLGIPTNYLWYLTWALHPDYPKKDKRPLSESGPQTLRLGLAAAMKVTSDYYKENADTVQSTALTEMARISGELSGADPLYLLYYKDELSGLEAIEENAFKDVPIEVQDYLTNSGAYHLHLENMHGLAERYEFARTLDMERGQRILMYHRLLLELRTVQGNWNQQIYQGHQIVTYQNVIELKQNAFSDFDEEAYKKISEDILKNLIILE